MNPTSSPSFARVLGRGRSALRVSPLGLGCWPISGPMFLDGKADHYGLVDDAESIRAIHAAIDAGVTFFDTADCYGAGHSERVLGQALRGRRQDVVIATKFGYTFDPASRQITGQDVSPSYVREACLASLERLQTEHIDLYQVHCGDVPPAMVEPIGEALERLCDEGLIGSYGWSTDSVTQIEAIASRPRFAAVQHEFNLFVSADEMLDLARESGVTSIARSPLAMGLLSGRYDAQSRFAADNVRGSGMPWLRYFRDGRPASEFLEQLTAVRDLLTTGGRTLIQGALGYLWAKSEITIPIPGFRSTQQATENAGAIQHGPLPRSIVEQIDVLLGRATNSAKSEPEKLGAAHA